MENIKEKMINAEFELFELRNECADYGQDALANKIEEMRKEIELMIKAF